ncbi:hypothetical protein Daesc_009695 [Daldinia eschscholtzii]|uniref:Ketosynthase family 3 (KS3) domain-containing protein n=1 Tax=Daldinia eschscholtzii TaxID=292717 RepID=A0AAX6MBP0_9PEZI
MTDDIAVVGFSFKLPQDVNDVSSFWEVLENKRNLMTEWPESRIKNGSFEASKEGNLRCRGGHFITDNPAAFDAPFFSVTAKEAASMDPMQRWTLEASYHAFENGEPGIEQITRKPMVLTNDIQLEYHSIDLDPHAVAYTPLQ